MSTSFRVKGATPVIPAGQVYELEAFDFVYLLTSTADLEISGDGNAFAPFPVKRGYKPRPGEQLGRIYVRNPTGGAVTATIVTGLGELVDFSDSSTSGSNVNMNLAAIGGGVTVPVSIAAALAIADGLLPFSSVANRVGGSVAIAAVGAVDLVAAQGAGLRFHLTSLQIANDGAVDNVAIILDGAAELFRVAVKAGTSQQLTFPVPEHTTANTALRINVTGATSIRARARGYVGA